MLTWWGQASRVDWRTRKKQTRAVATPSSPSSLLSTSHSLSTPQQNTTPNFTIHAPKQSQWQIQAKPQPSRLSLTERARPLSRKRPAVWRSTIAQVRRKLMRFVPILLTRYWNAVETDVVCRLNPLVSFVRSKRDTAWH